MGFYGKYSTSIGMEIARTALTLLSPAFILNSCSLRYLRLLGVLPRAWGGDWTGRGGFRCSSKSKTWNFIR